MGLFNRFSEISRKRKIELFFELMQPSKTDKVLDIGAVVGLDRITESRLQIIDVYPYKKNMSAVNLSKEHVDTVLLAYPEIDAKTADARALPWPDKYFDIVYSNAVIEHVGGFEDQKQMASEIMRVGRRWFVTTPNRWFPFEFHLRLPFVTWLPFHGYTKASRIICYNHVQRKYVFGLKRDDFRLMRAGELRACFPGSRIMKHRVTIMPETLIAVGGEAEVDRRVV